MKIVIIGGTGLTGSKTVARLRRKGHKVIAASSNTGINTITGKSLAEALNGDRHGVSANDSKTEAAKLLAVFVVETTERELVYPMK